MKSTHVVLGAAGALGAAIVRHLNAMGAPVRAVVRNPAAAQRLLPPAVEIAAGDGRDPDAVTALCRDAAVIYHCINVPYSQWAAVLPGVTDHALAAAAAAGARLVFPGNVYAYGPFQTVPATEQHPLAATGPKGRLRADLEQRLLAAHRSGQAPVVIPKFPDYYGPNVTNALFGAIMRGALAGRRAMWPGRLDQPHDLVYVDDAAAACALLAATEPAYGQVWHVPGPGPVTGREFLAMVFDAARRPLRPGSYGRGLLRLAGLFNAEAREMIELLYEFEEPLVLDGTRFCRAFPAFRYTPHADAVSRTLDWFRAHPAA